MRSLILLTVSVALFAACSSSHHAAHSAVTTTTAAPRAQTTREAAVVLASSMLDRFVPPPGARITAAEANRHGPFSGIDDIGHIVTARREWTVDAAADPALKFLQEHVPAGFQRRNDFSPMTRVADRQVLRWDLREEMQPLPLNVAAANLEVGVVPGAGHLDLTVDARVQWADLRPAATFAPERDRVVVIKFVRDQAPPRIIRSVVITDASHVAEIVRAFNSLPVRGPGIPSCSPPMNTPISYRISFATSTESPAELGAALSETCGVWITVHGVNLDDPNFVFYKSLEFVLRPPVN
jgi:hypothetical protein